MDLTCRTSDFGDLASLWHTPEWFPINLAPEENALMLVPVSERLYHDANFLDDREIPTDDCVVLPLDEAIRLAQASPERDRPVHGIFHIAFCGSTLISRCLDRLAGAMVLKEPYPFHDLAFRRRHEVTGPAEMQAWQGQFELLMALMGRTFHPGQAAIIKPTDASTSLIGELLARSRESRVLFLYVGLEEFLVSLLDDDIRMGFVDHRLEDLSVLLPDQAVMAEGRRRDLTGAQRAACLWWLHMRLYGDAARMEPGCRSLNFETFLHDPPGTLRAIAGHFGIPASDPEIGAAIASTLPFNSKESGSLFHAGDRLSKRRAVSERFRDEIRLGLEWAEHRLAELPHPVPPLPLRVV
jgi:hypothetical protein